MSDRHPQGTAMEQGKAAILGHVQALMESGGVELRLLVFTWEHDTTYSRWVLRMLRGKERHSLKFTERDVAAWPRYPVVPAKYQSGINTLVEKLRPRAHE